jgi:lysophospholipase L1-like esterase
MNSDKTMVILGASYAAGWKIESLAGMRVVNKGVGGEETRDMLARFDRDVVAQRPQRVLLWGFINDVFRAPADRVDEKLAQARANFVAMVERARARGITPILATEVTIRRQAGIRETVLYYVGPLLGKQSYQDRVNTRIREVNIWLRDFAKQQGLQLLDFEAVLANRAGERAAEFAVEDGSHLSAAAYEALSQYGLTVLGN